MYIAIGIESVNGVLGLGAITLGPALAAVLVFAGVSAGSAGEVRTEGVGPESIAYLYGGTKRAVLAALGSLRSCGLVIGQDEMIRLRWDVEPAHGATELERAIIGVVTEPVRFRRLTGDATVFELAARMDKDLVDRGLLLSRWRRKAMEYCIGVLIVEALLGILLCARLSSFLPLAWTGFMAVIVWRASRVTNRSAAGDAELERLREVHEHLGPWHRPNWRRLTPNTAALYVALYGLEAVETTDVEFVECAGLRWRSGGRTDDSAVHDDTGPDL